ncbi:hypothetical protein CEF21_05640 [Bacillus sp. FJAT-42376]|nr:hypothetical protein CEF21_05640 [Bacillus sp. FJAT-42376]
MMWNCVDLAVIDTELPVIDTELPVIDTELPVIDMELPVIGMKLPAIGTKLPVIGMVVPVFVESWPVSYRNRPLFSKMQAGHLKIKQQAILPNIVNAILSGGAERLNTIIPIASYLIVQFQ